MNDDCSTDRHYTTLVDVLEGNRGVDRAVTYVDGENSERRVPYGEVHCARARHPVPPASHRARSAATR